MSTKSNSTETEEQSDSGSLTEERVLDVVAALEVASVLEVVSILGRDEMDVQRELDRLEADGYVVKFRYPSAHPCSVYSIANS